VLVPNVRLVRDRRQGATGAWATINQFLFTPGQVFLSPGFLRAYGDETIHVPNADVRLRDPAADVPAFSDAVHTFVGAGTPVFDINAVARRVDTTTSVESTALTLLAGAVAVAAAGRAGRSSPRYRRRRSRPLPAPEPLTCSPTCRARRRSWRGRPSSSSPCVACPSSSQSPATTRNAAPRGWSPSRSRVRSCAAD
jgi:hypothetical protein